MLTRRIGLQTAVSLGGVNVWWVLNQHIFVRNLQLSISLRFLPGTSPQPAVDTEALVIGYFSNGWPTFSADSAQHVRGPYFDTVNPFGSIVVDNPNGFSVGTGPALAGCGTLFATILKSTAPSTVNKEIDLNSLDYAVGPNSCFVLHVDGGGAPADVEIQGVLYYDFNSANV